MLVSILAGRYEARCAGRISVRRILGVVRDIFEIYIPALAFLTMFIAFIIQVTGRFVINVSTSWTRDLIVVCFVWTVLFGACYAMRSRKHIAFALIYCKLKPKPAALSRLAGNLIILVIFILLFIPSLRYSLSLHLLRTTTLKINYTCIFLPFIYLILSVIGYTIVEIIEDFKVLRGSLADSAAHTQEEYKK